MVNLGKWEWGWGKELLLERYSFMQSEKSSLVLTVMLFRSKACLRYYTQLLSVTYTQNGAF